MTLYYFHILSKAQQQRTLLEKGIYLAERIEGFFRIMLYQLEDFYVEVYFVNHSNKVALFRSFNDAELLEPYLNNINLSGLLQEVFTEK